MLSAYECACASLCVYVCVQRTREKNTVPASEKKSTKAIKWDAYKCIWLHLFDSAYTKVFQKVLGK